MSAITVEFGGVPLVVQFGENTQLAIDAAARARDLVGAAHRSGTLADREAIPLADRKRGMRFLVTVDGDGNPIWREFEWRLAGDPSGPLATGAPRTSAGWEGLYTESERKNLGIGFFNQLDQSQIKGVADFTSLAEDLEKLDEATRVEITDLQARTITSGANPVVEVDASLTGVAPDSLSVSWAGFKVAIDKLPWRTKDQAALKDFFVSGNSIDDATDGPMWHTILAARKGVTSRFTARYSSDQHQLYRAGLEPLILTIQGGTLPVGGTAVAITAINGNAPININAPYAFLSTGDASLTTGVTMTGVIIDGANSRHGTAAAPNAASAAYTLSQDAGQPALTLTGPVLFVPDIAKYPAISDNFCGIGQNIFYSGVPNFFGDHTNPEAYAIIDRFAAAADGNRFLIRDVLPDASWPGDGTPATPIDGVDYKNHQFAAMEAFNARNEQRHPGSRARTLPKPGYPNGMTLLQYLQTRGDGSANDNTDIAAGLVPRSLRKDSLHPNLAGQTAMADFFEEAMQAQALAPAVTADTFFTLSAVGTLPRTGEATSASNTVRVQTGAEALLDARLDALEYGSGLQITSFTVTPSIIEAGGSANIAIAGAISGAVTSFSVSDSAGGAIATSGPASGFTGTKNGVNSARTLTLTAQNTGAPGGTDTKTRTATIAFANKGHAGTINKAAGITSAEVNGMSQSWFATALARTLTFTTAADGRLWYSQPASQADPSAFKIGGLTISPDKFTRDHVTATGQTVSYRDFLLSGGVVSAGTTITLEVIA